MSLTESIQKKLAQPASAAEKGLSGWFDGWGPAEKSLRSALGGSAGANWSRSAVVGSAALCATVVLGAAVAYRSVRKTRQDKGAHPPVDRFATIEGVKVAGSRQIASVTSSSNANAQPLGVFASEAIEYTRQSFDNGAAFFEKLTRARKLDDVVELQSEFVRRAYGDFITSAFKVVELCSNIAVEAFASSLGASKSTAKVAADIGGKVFLEADRRADEITSRVQNTAKQGL